MNDLRTAAQQALEALEQSRVFVTTREKIKHPEGTEWYDERITALKAALAEPVQEPYTDDVTRIMRDAGMTFHLGLPHKAVVEQMTRVVDLVYAEASIKAAQQFATPPQTAEPVQEPVAWRVMLPDGYQFVYDERMLRVIDEGIHATRQPLYTTPPQRLPLTEEEIEAINRDLRLWRCAACTEKARNR